MENFFETIKRQTIVSTPFCHGYQKSVNVEDTYFIVLVQTLSPKHDDEFRVLHISCFYKKAPEIFNALNENREDLLKYFDVKSIYFPTDINQEEIVDIPEGWARARSCLFYGLVSCTFLIKYTVKDYFTLQIAISTLGNLTFESVANRLKDIAKTASSGRSLSRFREKHVGDFKIGNFAFQRDFFIECKSVKKFGLDDLFFSEYIYTPCCESLCFKALINE